MPRNAITPYRSALDTLAQRLGLRLLPTWRLKDWHAARRLGTLLRDLQIDCVLDVGANRGQYRDFLRTEVGYHGLIYSYEPQQARCDEMARRRGEDFHWQITRTALGREPGLLPLRVTEQDMFSSLLPPRTDAVAKMTGYNTTAAIEEVPVNTLRAVWPAVRAASGATRAFLKIDTQGFDLEVLAGAGDTLAEVPLIQTELSVQPLYAGAPSYLDAIAALTGRGYVLAGLHPVSVDGAHLVEVDGLFVRQEAR